MSTPMTARRHMIVDLFAGAGGASKGIEAATGRPIDIAINHDDIALAVHQANHPDTHHEQEDIWNVSPTKATHGRPVAILWGSPDCRHFSGAKGSAPRSKSIRSLAWSCYKWADEKRPLVFFLENVREFEKWGPLDEDGHPIKELEGTTFDRWIKAFEALGYVVEWRMLDASLYNVPTKRQRLFIIARRDGQPIVWPEPTNGPGKLPLRPAAECIDWSLDCPSIFKAGRNLADNTMWRIAEGLRRFVLDSDDPFVIGVGGRAGQSPPTNASRPLGTITSKADKALVAPTLIQSGYGERKGQAARVPGLHKPLGTVMADGVKHSLVSAFLAKHFGGVVGNEVTEPLSTITKIDHHSPVVASLVKFRGTDGQKPAQDMREPMPTVTSGGRHLGELRAFLTTYYGSDSTGGQSLKKPLRTLTQKHRMGLVTIEGTEYQIVDIGMRMLQPHELLAAQFGDHAPSYDLSAAHPAAMATIEAARDRVSVAPPGEIPESKDEELRLRLWRQLKGIVKRGGELSKEKAVALIGNSVCPSMAEAIVKANNPFDYLDKEQAA